MLSQFPFFLIAEYYSTVCLYTHMDTCAHHISLINREGLRAKESDGRHSKFVALIKQKVEQEKESLKVRRGYSIG